MKSFVNSSDRVTVTSASSFPELVSIESDVFYLPQKRAGQAFANLGASCRVFGASLPLFDLYVLVGILILVIS